MRTTKKNFNIFVKECRKWIDRLNLNDYRWAFFHQYLDGNTAECTHSYSAKIITVTLSTEASEYDRARIPEIAFHEVFEAYLWEIESMCRNRDDESSTEKARHAIVHRVWNILKGIK